MTLRRFSFLCLVVLAISFCAPASAEHRDPAPIPDDVVQKLFKSFNIGQPTDRLVGALNQSLDEAVTLIKQMQAAPANTSADASGYAHRMLLESKIQELRGLRDEFRARWPAPSVSADGKTIAALSSQGLFALQVENRFERILEALGDVQASPDRASRERTLAKAREVLYALHEKPRERKEMPHAIPAPTFRQDTPTKLKPQDLPEAPPPQYLASQPAPGNNVYAFAGDVLLLAAAPPTPTQAQTCGYGLADLDLAQSDEMNGVTATNEISNLAASLSYSPAKIFEYVANNVKYEPYFGSLKGAMGTLYAMSGNPTDQASLLIALLRASGVPARYVYGTIQFDNDPRVLNWIGAKTITAATKILKLGQIGASSDPTSNHIEFPHVWVEACVPYGNYRGTGIDQTGFRWIPLDPSFKQYAYQPGIATSVNFDFTTAGYLAKRVNGPDSLPQEQYALQVASAIQSSPPNFANNTLQDVGYVGTPVPLKVDILPASLPYSVKTFNAWDASAGYTTAETATVPDSHRYKFQISGTYFSTPVTLSMPKIVLQRVTYSYRGATTADENNFNILMGGSGTSTLGTCSNSTTNLIPCTVNPLYLVASIKLDGQEVAAGNAFNYFTVSSFTLDVSSYPIITMNPSTVTVPPADLTLTVTLGGLPLNSAPYPGAINALDIQALQAYAFQASDRLLTERAARLLNSVHTISNPDSIDPVTGRDNRDDTIGEFLHLSGLKYMRYITDAAKFLGELDGSSGWSGNHLGLTSTYANATYVFDLPYAISSSQPVLDTFHCPCSLSAGNRKDLLVDVRGGLSRGVDLTTGNPVWQTFLLWGYTGSAYESYLWQENAKLDAVSTVRGIQFANDKKIEVLTLTAANFGNCTDSSSQCYKLTHNDFGLNYAASQVSQIQNQINQGYTFILPRSLIQYNNWTGSLWISTLNAGSNLNAGFWIGGTYSGGYTVGNYLPEYTYNPAFDTGGFNTTNPGDWINTYGTPSTINSVVGLGTTPGACFAGDPVNMVTGNVYHTERDISIKGRGGMPIIFERSYNSRDASSANATNGPLGYGWTHSFNHYLLFRNAAGTTSGNTTEVVWVDGTGNQKYIQVAGTSTGVAIGSAFTPPQGYFFQTSRNSDGTYSIREKNGLTYTFGAVSGGAGTVAGMVGDIAKLLSIADRNGNTLTMGYTNNNLTSVTDGLSRALTFAYDANNHITDIHDWTGRDYRYNVDANGNLTSFSNPLAVAGKQNPVTYAYYTSTDGTNLNHALKRYTLPRGNGMTFEYYMNGKAFRHYDDLGETTTFTYNDFRRETVTVNERGFERHFFFDQNGNPIKIVEENGATRVYTYDPNNPFNRLTKQDPMGYITKYTYDNNGNVTQITNPSNSVTVYDYFNTFSEPGRIEDANGNYTILQYDSNGNLLQQFKLKSGVGSAIDPTKYTPNASQLVAWTINTYDAYGNIATTEHARDFTAQIGPTVAYNYNDTVNGVVGLNAVSITRSGDKNGDGTIDAPDIANLSYDALGRVKSGIDAEWQPKQYVYDDLDRVIQGTDTYGNLRNYQFDPNGNPSGQTLTGTANGVSTIVDSSSAGYDSSDRQNVSLDAGGFATSYQYDASGNVILITNPDNYSLAFEYDAGNHVTKAYDQEGNAVIRTVDLDGKPRTVTDPNGNIIQYIYYDSTGDGRLKQKIDGVGRKTTYTYDGNGNVVTVTDNNNNVTYISYDELNRPVRMAYPYNDSTQVRRPVTQYTYDSLGNLTVIATGSTDATGTNPANDVVATQMTYLYDDFGRKLKETDALGHFWAYQYDLNNNVTQMTDAKNQLTQYTWGYGHQLLSKKDAAGNLTSYIRNSLGQPLVAQSPAVRYNYSYDDAHRLKSVTDSRGNKTLAYSYSPGGLLNSLIDSNGNRTDYLYDPVGRLAGIWAPNLDFIGFDYDASGRLTEKWLPNGVDTRYTYNPDNTLSQVVNRLNSGVISQHDYTYDTLGNRATDVERIGATTTSYGYSYDALNRLTTVRDTVANTQLASFTYGARHNRTSQTVGTTTSNYQYGTGGFLLQQTTDVNGNPTAGFVYDANDNLIQKCEGGTVTRSDTACTGTTVTNLTYDALNRLTQVTKAGSTETYLYDDQGRRIQKTAGSTPTSYLYNGPDIEAEYANNSWTAPSAQYTNGPNWDDPISRISATTTQYYHQDGLGSVVAVTDSTGVTSGTERFDAFGNKLASTGSVPQYGYTGREPDNTGLVYYRARYYDPTIGRFTQRDPIGFQGGINVYIYADNSPTNYTDPTGTQAFNNALTNFATLNTSYFDTTPAGTGGLSSGSQSLASVNPPSSYLSDASNAAQSLVPGNTYANYSTSAFQSGDYGTAALYGVAAVADVGLAVMTAGTGSAVETLGREVVQTGSSISARVAELSGAIPAAQQGRITMGVGLAEDANGIQRVLIGTSEPRGYLRPGVTLNPGETLAPGSGHAEADIVNFAQQNGFRLLEVGATRSICPSCAALIEGAGARVATPLKKVP